MFEVTFYFISHPSYAGIENGSKTKISNLLIFVHYLIAGSYFDMRLLLEQHVRETILHLTNLTEAELPDKLIVKAASGYDGSGE